MGLRWNSQAYLKSHWLYGSFYARKMRAQHWNHFWAKKKVWHPWQLKKFKSWGRFGATSYTALPIQPIWPIFEVNRLDWHCCLAGSSKMAPRILIFFQLPWVSIIHLSLISLRPKPPNFFIQTIKYVRGLQLHLVLEGLGASKNFGITVLKSEKKLKQRNSALLRLLVCLHSKWDFVMLHYKPIKIPTAQEVL